MTAADLDLYDLPGIYAGAVPLKPQLVFGGLKNGRGATGRILCDVRSGDGNGKVEVEIVGDLAGVVNNRGKGRRRFSRRCGGDARQEAEAEDDRQRRQYGADHWKR